MSNSEEKSAIEQLQEYAEKEGISYTQAAEQAGLLWQQLADNNPQTTFFIWSHIAWLRRKFESDGNPIYAMQALDSCICYGLCVPLWVASWISSALNQYKEVTVNNKKGESRLEVLLGFKQRGKGKRTNALQKYFSEVDQGGSAFHVRLIMVLFKMQYKRACLVYYNSGSMHDFGTLQKYYQKSIYYNEDQSIISDDFILDSALLNTPEDCLKWMRLLCKDKVFTKPELVEAIRPYAMQILENDPLKHPLPFEVRLDEYISNFCKGIVFANEFEITAVWK